MFKKETKLMGICQPGKGTTRGKCKRYGEVEASQGKK